MSEGEGPSRGPTVPLTAAASDEATALLREFSPSQIDRLATAVDLHDSQPTKIGPYRIVRVIGEGGMGVVYLAEQLEPIRRTVALKLIKLGMDTRQVIARFESERQALAVLNHPNVAKVLDAGTTETGRPYFVMEYVPGEPITGFCDRHKYTTTQRLQLFMQACEAVQHAHQKAIIHRDLKPSNILVMLEDGKPLVKVIDFGVAKATAQKLTERTLFTEAGQLIGTPEYMSPEQAELTAIDVDTRSDIYSLGVVLYELLTGALPFDPATLRASSFDEIRRIIREVDPPRPSTRLSSLREGANEIASRRQTQIQELTKQLRSELEWIPLKALRKDRAQRYATATEFALDIANYLDHRPLIAGPESTTYRLRKFLKRNKGPAAAVAAIVLVLLAGVIVTSIALIGQSKARARAEAAEENAQAVNEFLTNDVLSGAGPDRLPDKTIRDAIVKAMLDPAAAAVKQRFKDKPLVEAAVRKSLALTYNAIGRADVGLEHAIAALEIRRRVLGDDHRNTIGSLNTLAAVKWSLGDYAEAEQLFKQALERSGRILGEDDPHTILQMNNYAVALESRGRLVEAEPLHKGALERRRRLLGEDHSDTITSLHNYALVLEQLGRSTEAQPLFKHAWELSRRVAGDNHPDTITRLNSYGFVLRSLGRAAEAEPLLRQGLEQYRQVLGPDHPHTMTSLSNYVLVLQSLGRFAEAEPLAKEALERRRRVQGDGHADTIRSLNIYASVLQSLGRVAEAEPLFKDALERRRRVLGEDHPETLTSLHNYAFALEKLGRAAEAEPLSKEALERRRRVLGEDHPNTMSSLNSYASVLLALGRLDEAEPLFHQVLELRRRVLGVDHPNTIRSLNNYGRLLVRLGRSADAEGMFRQALERRRRVLGDHHPDTLESIHDVAVLLEMQGKLSEAEPLFAELYSGASAAVMDPRETAKFMSRYGRLLVAMKQYQRAEDPLNEAYKRLKATGQEASVAMRMVVNALAKVCEQSNRPEEAIKWRAELAVLQAATQPATSPTTAPN